MTEVGLLAAFAAGVLALLSPCSALLLPSFFAYAFASRSALLLRTAAFYGGLLITLVPLGTGATAASSLFYGHRGLLISIAGWSIIALGTLQILGRSFAMPFAGRLQAWSNRQSGNTVGGRASWLSTVALGAVYGLAGFCSGPVLGAILTMAATRDSPLQGGLLLAVYALGMAAPLFVLAALWDRFQLGQRSWLRGRMLVLGPIRVHTTSLVSGLLFVGIGILFLRYDGTAGITGTLGLGDTTDLEFEAQRWISEVAATVPAWVLPAGIAVVAGLVAWRRARRTPTSGVPDEREETVSS
ncbi:MAG TPA: cytochrome c biogenesis CcdA family protein [Nocardioidaceae bacterium]|nr:cytochrome c biogenesis CcdA family protein [Nocardioidaceae bacterium]